MTTATIKTYKEWWGSSLTLTKFLQPGDLVDEEMAEYFLGVLPPACHTGKLIQIGEPYSHVAGFPTYMTIERTPEGWTYRGICFVGRTTPA
jgi:hypothetical protein